MPLLIQVRSESPSSSLLSKIIQSILYMPLEIRACIAFLLCLSMVE